MDEIVGHYFDKNAFKMYFKTFDDPKVIYLIYCLFKKKQKRNGSTHRGREQRVMTAVLQNDQQMVAMSLNT